MAVERADVVIADGIGNVGNRTFGVLKQRLGGLCAEHMQVGIKRDVDLISEQVGNIKSADAKFVG